jgi:hypothetical protein
MSQETSAQHDESVEPSIDAPKSLTEYVKTTVINTLPPLVAYYALRAFGLTPYLALAGAIVTAVAQGVFNMVRNRKFEPMNGLVIVAAGCSLAIAFTTRNPRMVQITELIPATLMVWSCLLSGLLRKPTSKKFAGLIVPTLADAALPDRGWTDQDIRDWHTLHTRLCLWLGLLCGIFPAVAVLLIFNLPVDVSQFLLVSIGSTLLVLSIATAVAFMRKFMRQRDRPAAERTVSPAET